MGWHISGEMGGVWAHPIKLLDGFWLEVDGIWLTAASLCRIGPYWAEHEYEVADLHIVRHEWVPDDEPAVVVRYRFEAKQTRTRRIRFLARTDLRSVWSPAPAAPRPVRDAASFDQELQAWRCDNHTGEWTVLVGAIDCRSTGREWGDALWGPAETGGEGVSVLLQYEVQIDAGRETELTFVIAGSEVGCECARATYRRVGATLPALAAAKRERYGVLLARSALSVPDVSLGRAWDWIKCDYDWLIRSVQPWGQGLGAGMADYPWWFGCDNGYAIRGCLVLGQHETALDTLDLVRELSVAANGQSGRVIHEANTWGVASHAGNSQETPHFARAVWDAVRWTGDMAFLERNYTFCKRGVLGWLLGQQCPDGDVLPHGYGIMEMGGLDLQCIDTAALTVDALGALTEMADLVGESDVAQQARSLRVQVRTRMDELFWMESEGVYGDMVGTPAEMIPRFRRWREEAVGSNPAAARAFEGLLREAELAPDPERKRPWLVKNWTVLCPLEDGLVDRGRALRTLRRVEGPEFSGRWGVYVSGVYQDTMMSLGTGVLATAEASYGRVERTLEYVHMLTETLDMQMPGAIAEVSPAGGCFVQAWSGYAVAWPVVAGIFGVHPDAARHEVTLRPTFPPGWRFAGLYRLRIGSNMVDLEWDGERLRVVSREEGWTVRGGSVPLQVERGRVG